jgi:oligosaccharide repeat unit polymerase
MALSAVNSSRLVIAELLSVAVLFLAGLLAYYGVFFRKQGLARDGGLAKLLWFIYFALGVAALFVEVTNVLPAAYDPSYKAAAYLLGCILISVSGFLRFKPQDVSGVILTVRGQSLIEAMLIALQGFSIAFFSTFALSSIGGDVGANRLELSSKAEVLGSYGAINTVAGAGSHLFMISLVMACVRLCQNIAGGQALLRPFLLIAASLSYVVYVLAYVGRDGAIYWLMTALMVFLLFRRHMPVKTQRWIILAGSSISAMILVPIVVITAARFSTSEFGANWSLLEYFGTQINNFSDYASIDRPQTYGSMNFPLILQPYCSAFNGLSCENWETIKPYIFDQYLTQGQVPWLFATYVSDFVADFGYFGALVFISLFSVVCHLLCVMRDSNGFLSLSRLLLILLLFLTPYWGVFYFRFGIINSFLIVNVGFIFFIWMLQKLYVVDDTKNATQTAVGNSINSTLEPSTHG